MPDLATGLSSGPADTDTAVTEIDPMDKVYRRRYRLVVWPFRIVALGLLALIAVAAILTFYGWIHLPDKVADILREKSTGWDTWAYALIVAMMTGWFVPKALMEMPKLRRWAMGAPCDLDEREIADRDRVSHYTLQLLTYGTLYAATLSGFVPVLKDWEPHLHVAFGIVFFARGIGWVAARFRL